MREYYDLFVRYLLLILVALPNLDIFYIIFTPLTIYPIYGFLGLFFEVTLKENILVLEGISIEIIQSCVAGAAYYLLLILNLSTPKIKLNQRVKMVIIAFTSFLFLNILRIVLLSLIMLTGSPFFDAFHKLSWYFLSILFVLGIWFTEVKMFKIKEIPFYSDIKNIYKK